MWLENILMHAVTVMRHLETKER
nr:unnamed protein product [Callosobruchus analis]